MEYIKFQIVKTSAFNGTYQVLKDNKLIRKINSNFFSNTYSMYDAEGEEILYFKGKNIFSSKYTVHNGSQYLGKIVPKLSFLKLGLLFEDSDKYYEIEGNPLRRKWIISRRNHEVAIFVRKKWAIKGLMYEMAIQENEHNDLLFSMVIALDIIMQKRKSAG